MAESDPDRSQPDALGAALGRLPSGLFILTVRRGDRATGMLASWVQQAGFDPPMLTVALARDRYVGDWIAEAGRFALNVIPSGDKRFLKHFARGFSPDSPAFDGIELLDRARGGPVLAGAMAFLDVDLVGRHDGQGDHIVYLGRVVDGEVLDPDRRPMVHVRRSGDHY